MHRKKQPRIDSALLKKTKNTCPCCMWFSSLRLSASNFSGAAEKKMWWHSVFTKIVNESLQHWRYPSHLSYQEQTTRARRKSSRFHAKHCAESLGLLLKFHVTWSLHASASCLCMPSESVKSVLLQDNFGSALRSVGAPGGWIVFARCHPTWKPKELGGNLSNFKSYIYVHTGAYI